MEFDSEGKMEMAIKAGAEQHPRYSWDVEKDPFVYGTAGFRMKEDKLDFVLYNMGILAALRSKKMGSQTIGIMITASHNKAEDNGVKLVDPQGDMLEQEWEKYATYLVNAKSPEESMNAFGQLLMRIPIKEKNKEANVIFARDTRPSGDRLVKALKTGLEAVNAKYVDYGILTTPQLHYLVKATNTQNSSNPYGEVSEEGYYKKIAEAYKTAMDGVKPNGAVAVDCANGVGAPKLKEMIKHLPTGEGELKIRVVNDNIEKAELLNKDCGADYVKTQQRTPLGFDGKAWDRWASFDGDADRIVYYFNEEGPVFHLLDGDRIATIAAKFIGDLVQKAGIADKIKLSVVQTAYANGASTRYIKDSLKLKVECTPTGVKHLHHAAARSDVGVYFEANGHGTVLFSPSALKRIHNHEPESPAQLDALTTLRALTDLINQTVGDAISDLLLVEVVLAHTEFSVREWLATYTDVPNKLAKLKVKAKAEFVVQEGTAETKLARPEGVQEKLDEIVAKYNQGRAFVRPSGTEDAVRIYGEAKEAYDCDDMVQKVWEYLSNKCAQGVQQ